MIGRAVSKRFHGSETVVRGSGNITRSKTVVSGKHVTCTPYFHSGLHSYIHTVLHCTIVVQSHFGVLKNGVNGVFTPAVQKVVRPT